MSSSVLQSLLGLSLLFSSLVQGAQIPLVTQHTQSQVNFQSALAFAGNSESWSLEVLPSENATGHLVFETVSSLLQHWPNTRYRHGHNVVPGTVAPGTLLYHGRGDDKIPSVPEWTATDPEHSYLFCRGMQNSGCWQLTLVTVRPLNVLYFDGSSAAKMQDGSMDTQDVFAYGEILPDKYFAERERLQLLCEWGRKFDIDGFARMEMDFEIMLCDFTAGVEVESFLNLRAAQRRRGPGRRPDRPPPGGPGEPGEPPHPPGTPHHYPEAYFSPLGLDPNSTLFPRNDFEVLHSGSWHNHYPGDTRIQLDLAHMISFYDTELAPSLIPERFGKTRLQHRLLGLDKAELQDAVRRIEGVYSSPSGQSASGIDWATLIRVVVDRYANRLELVQYHLNATDPSDSASDLLTRAQNVQVQLMVMLQPYMLADVKPPNPSSSRSWASPVYKLCATTHTRYITTSLLQHRLTDAEQLLLRGVQETTREICRTVTGMWVDGVMLGLDPDLSSKARTTEKDTEKLELVLSSWKQRTETLMRWLDWSVWLKCRPACGFEEMCYLPTWPFGWRSAEESKDPQPRCIRRIAPYEQSWP